MKSLKSIPIVSTSRLLLPQLLLYWSHLHNLTNFVLWSIVYWCQFNSIQFNSNRFIHSLFSFQFRFFKFCVRCRLLTAGTLTASKKWCLDWILHSQLGLPSTGLVSGGTRRIYFTRKCIVIHHDDHLSTYNSTPLCHTFTETTIIIFCLFYLAVCRTVNGCLSELSAAGTGKVR